MVRGPAGGEMNHENERAAGGNYWLRTDPDSPSRYERHLQQLDAETRLGRCRTCGQQIIETQGRQTTPCCCQGGDRS